MPSFSDSARSESPPEEVWKVLYDPARFPEWWSGVETVRAEDAAAGETRYTMYPEGYPDFPMPQVLRSERRDRCVTVSCLVSELRFEWRLEPEDGGSATRISVEVGVPEQEGHRLERQRAVISESLDRLARLAAAG